MSEVANSSGNLTSSGVKKSLTTDAAVRFLQEAADYFSNRPINGEDMTHLANVYNAENCRKAANRLTALEAENKALREDAKRIYWAGAKDMRELLAEKMSAFGKSIHTEALPDFPARALLAKEQP